MRVLNSRLVNLKKFIPLGMGKKGVVWKIMSFRKFHLAAPCRRLIGWWGKDIRQRDQLESSYCEISGMW